MVEREFAAPCRAGGRSLLGGLGIFSSTISQRVFRRDRAELGTSRATSKGYPGLDAAGSGTDGGVQPVSLGRTRSGNNIKLPPAFGCLRNSNERVSKPCAQRRAERAALAVAHAAGRSEACAGGSMDRRTLGYCRSRLPHVVTGYEGRFAYTRATAQSRGVYRSHQHGARLSQGIHLRKGCACAASSAAGTGPSFAVDSGQSFPRLGGPR